MTVTEAQTWAALGVLAAFAFGVLGLFSTLIVRVIRTEVGRLEAKMALVKHTFGLDRG